MGDLLKLCQSWGISIAIGSDGRHRSPERFKCPERRWQPKTLRSEVSANELFRCIDLPGLINPERVSAQLTNGVLELTMPKAALAKEVEVKAA
jgi:HSP20 family molecular chaperone IbpA